VRPFACPSLRSLQSCSSGFVVLWFGFVVLWFSSSSSFLPLLLFFFFLSFSSSSLWFYGFVVLWFCGFVVLWFCGFTLTPSLLSSSFFSPSPLPLLFFFFSSLLLLLLPGFVCFHPLRRHTALHATPSTDRSLHSASTCSRSSTCSSWWVRWRGASASSEVPLFGGETLQL
jgi:hypothetical protein